MAGQAILSTDCCASEKFVCQITNDEPTKAETTRTTLSRTFLRCLPFCGFLKQKRRSEPETASRKINFPEGKILRTSTFSTVSLPRMDPKIEAAPYHWPIGDAIFDPKTTALVIIDMQNDFCAPGGYIQAQGYDISDAQAIIPNIQKLLSAFRVNGMAIYHTREGHRPDLSTLSDREHARSKLNKSGLGIGDLGPMGRLLIRGEKGHDIIPELYPMAGENIIDKPGRSAFQHTEFGLMLSIKGIKNLVLCGVTTDVCVHSTMREANDNRFDCLLVGDATAASERHLQTAALASVVAEGGIFGAVSTTEKVLAAFGFGAAGQKIPSNAEDIITAAF